MEGHTIFMNNGSNQGNHYTPDLTNGQSEVPVSAGVNEPQEKLSEDIIKNIAVEKDLSEIASAYNLHRTENDKTNDLAMEVDTPTDFKDACAFESDKSDQQSEVTDMDSQDGSESTSQQSKDTELLPTDSQKDTEDSKDVEAGSGKDENEKQSQDTTANHEYDNSQDGEGKSGDENSQDATNETKENGEEEDDNIGNGRVRIKQEIQSEDEDNFVEGVCGLCNGEMDTSSHITMSKHLSEVHVNDDNDDIKCGVCHREYQERRSAVRHILNQHLNYKPYKCTQCTKSFARRDHLTRHERAHDPDTFDCKFCSEEFDTQAKLDRHFRSEHSENTKKRKSRNVTYEELDEDTIEDPSEPEQSESARSDSGSDSDAFVRAWNKKTRRTSRKKSPKKKAKRGRPKIKKVPMRVDVKREAKALSKAQQKKLDKEREQERKKKEEEARQRERIRRKKEKERMKEEERALERLREKERLREMREAKERQMKEEMRKKAEDLQRKLKEEEEHYFDGNYWEAAKKPMKETNTSGPDDFSINYTNFYGGNYHEPPKKSLGQILEEKRKLQETLLSGEYFLGPASRRQ